MKSIGFIFILWSCYCFAQGNLSSKPGSTNYINTLGSKVYSKTDVKPFKGSPYLFMDWNSRYIIQSISGQTITVENLNYNLETKELVSQMYADTLFKFDRTKLNYVINFNVKYKVINGELYQELSAFSQIVLYKGFTLKVIRDSKDNLSETDIIPKEYIKTEQYYCLINDTLKPIELNKRDVMECLADKADQIKVYCKENKLSFSSEADVIQIFNYYKRL